MALYQRAPGRIIPFALPVQPKVPVNTKAPIDAMRVGIVQTVGEWNCQVSIGKNQEMQALVAASCLLQPSVNDQVLVISFSDCFGYILAVLQQADSQQQQLRFSGDVQVQAMAGSIHLQAQETVSVASKHWQAVHHSMEVTAYEGKFTMHQLKARFQQVRYVAERLTRMITHLVHRSTTEHRQVDQHYALRTATHVEASSGLRQSTAKVSIQRAEQISMTADKVMINS